MPDVPAFSDSPADPSLPLPRSLDELERLVRRELDLVGYPAKAWLPPVTTPDGGLAHDVVIVGGGQSGLAAAFGLKRQRVDRVLVIDENPEGKEGPWDTYARMATLRTDKSVGGMELGIPGLSTRAWFEAQYGPRAWDAMEKLPRDMQHRYVGWYRRVLDIPVRNNCRLTGFGPDADNLIRLETETDGPLWCRKLIFATGIEGNGTRKNIPFIESLPRAVWAHTGDAIDFSALRGRRVGVLGGAASALDNASMAAEAGAASVHLFHRRIELMAPNPITWGQFHGFLAHFADLDAARRWRITHHFLSSNAGPPADTVERAARLPNLLRHPGTTWTGASLNDGRVTIQATDGAYDFDFLILGIGYVTDLTARPELSTHLDKIALWRDVYTPPEGLENADLSRSPYLGDHFEYQEKNPGQAPWLGSVFNFSRGAQLSMGMMPIGLSGIGFGVPRLVHGVCRALFRDNADLYEAGMKAWQTGA